MVNGPVTEVASNGGRMIVREVVSFMEGEWSFYRGAQFYGGRMVIIEVTLMEGECYRGGQFKGGRMVMLTLMGGRMVMLKKWWLMEGAWSCYRGGQYNGGRMLVMEVASLNEGEWSFYKGGQFNAGKMVMLQRWSV